MAKERAPISSVILDPELGHEVLQAALAWRPEGLSTPEFTFFDAASRYSFETHNPKFFPNAVFFFTNNLYADNTTRQVKRVSDLEHIKKHAWLFDPQEIVRRIDPENLETYDRVFYTILDFLKPSRYHGNRAAHNWIHNAHALVNFFDGDLGKFFAKCDYDLAKIQPMLQGPKKKKNWPLFKGFGTKTSRLALQSLSAFTIYPFKNAHEIGVPVDTQIASALIQTGVVKLVDGEARKDHVIEKTLVPYLYEYCKERGIPPRMVSEALFLLMHNLCNHLKHDQCPIAKWCTTKIDRYHLDEDGMFRYPEPQLELRWETEQSRIVALRKLAKEAREKAKKLKDEQKAA